MTEANLQEQICNYLSMICRRWGFIYFAPMNEGVMMVLTIFRIKKESQFKIISYMKKLGFLPGVSDIVILHKKGGFCMEVKLPDTPKKKHVQKPSQIIFEANCHRAGVEYVIVRSLDEAVKQLKIWGVVE